MSIPATGQSSPQIIETSSHNPVMQPESTSNLKRKRPSTPVVSDITNSTTVVAAESFKEPDLKRARTLPNLTVKQDTADPVTLTARKHLNLLDLPSEVLLHIIHIGGVVDTKNVLSLQLAHPYLKDVIKGAPIIYKAMLEEIAIKKMHSLLKVDDCREARIALYQALSRDLRLQNLGPYMPSQTDPDYRKVLALLKIYHSYQPTNSVEAPATLSQYCHSFEILAKSHTLDTIVKNLASKCSEQALQFNQLQDNPHQKALALVVIKTAQLSLAKNPSQIEELLSQALDAVNQIQDMSTKNGFLIEMVEMLLLIDVEKARQAANKLPDDKYRMNEFFKIVDALKDLSIKANVNLDHKWRKVLVKCFGRFCEQLGSPIEMNEFKADTYIKVAETLIDPLQVKVFYQQICETVDLVERPSYKIEANLGKVRVLVKINDEIAQQLFEEAEYLVSAENRNEPCNIEALIKTLIAMARSQVKKNPMQAYAYIFRLKSIGLLCIDYERDNNFYKIIDLLALINIKEALHWISLFEDSSWKALALLKIRNQMTDPKQANEIFEQAFKVAQSIEPSSRELPRKWVGSYTDKVYILLEMIKLQVPTDLNRALKIAEEMSKDNSNDQYQNFVLAHLEIVKMIETSADQEQIDEIFKRMLDQVDLIQAKIEKAKVLLMIANQRIQTDQKQANEIVDQVIFLIKNFLNKEEEEISSNVKNSSKDKKILELLKNLIPLYPVQAFNLVGVLQRTKKECFNNYAFYTEILSNTQRINIDKMKERI